MKPLVSYYGGKQRIATRIVEVVKTIPHTVYAEPFAGGLAVLFAKEVPPVTNGDHYREAINDKDERLITLYRVAREQPDELQRWIEATPYSQAEYRRAIEWLRHPQEHTPLELAWAYFVDINQSFASKLDAGWGTAVMTRNLAHTWHGRQLRIPEQLQRLSQVHIGCEDALRFIERWDSPQTLFYVDPPYPGTDCGHYDGYTLSDWAALCRVLDSCQGSYILSNYAQLIEPESTQQRIEIEAVMSAAKVARDRTQAMQREGHTRTEVLWICDRSHAIRPDLARVLNLGDYRPVPAMTQQLALF